MIPLLTDEQYYDLQELGYGIMDIQWDTEEDEVAFDFNPTLVEAKWFLWKDYQIWCDIGMTGYCVMATNGKVIKFRETHYTSFNPQEMLSAAIDAAIDYLKKNANRDGDTAISS